MECTQSDEFKDSSTTVSSSDNITLSYNLLTTIIIIETTSGSLNQNLELEL